MYCHVDILILMFFCMWHISGELLMSKLCWLIWMSTIVTIVVVMIVSLIRQVPVRDQQCSATTTIINIIAIVVVCHIVMWLLNMIMRRSCTVIRMMRCYQRSWTSFQGGSSRSCWRIVMRIQKRAFGDGLSHSLFSFSFHATKDNEPYRIKGGDENQLG